MYSILSNLGTNISKAYKVIAFGYKREGSRWKALEALEGVGTLEGVGMVPRGTHARAGKLPKSRSVDG